MAKQKNLFERHADAPLPPKQEAMQRVDENADEDWKRAFDIALVEVCYLQKELTSSDVLRHMDGDGDKTRTHDLRAVGPRMLAAAKQGIIQNSGLQIDTGSHARPQRVWVSLVYSGEVK